MYYSPITQACKRKPKFLHMPLPPSSLKQILSQWVYGEPPVIFWKRYLIEQVLPALKLFNNTSPLPFTEPPTSEHDIKSFSVQNSAGNKLDCKLYSAKQSSIKKFVVLAGGNRSCHEKAVSLALDISKTLALNVLTFNYRGVGKSEGYPTRARDLTEDTKAILAYLMKIGAQEKDICIYGRSLGGGVGAAAAASYPGVHFCSDRSFSSLGLAIKHFIQKKTYPIPLNPLGYLGELLLSRGLEWEWKSCDLFEKKITGKKCVIFVDEKEEKDGVFDAIIPYKVSLKYALQQRAYKNYASIPISYSDVSDFPNEGKIEVHHRAILSMPCVLKKFYDFLSIALEL